jgi:hypothetical protein
MNAASPTTSVNKPCGFVRWQLKGTATDKPRLGTTSAIPIYLMSHEDEEARKQGRQR